ncbi:hypothetical protein [Frondihabitans cladoniiphilus]|uniref:ASCH domain-containing protein n=1 Tax=Frondihabitans cladoniiphilus TaxID=715785 RepID=A0ABP8W0J2_9MICO
MTRSPSLGSAALWHELTVGLVLPDRVFGAAVDIDGLLSDPELHFAATLTTSRLLLMPRAGSFARLSLEWETLPEIGVFTAAMPPGDDSLTADDRGRLETWMRDVASSCHALRDRIRESAERAVRDASEGQDTSLPESLPPHAHVVSAHVGTRVVGPSEGSPVGAVDVAGAGSGAAHPPLDAVTDESVFVERATGRVLGRRRTTRVEGEVVAVDYRAEDARVGRADLVRWYDQHIDREVLFDDVWQVYVHLLAGLEAPATVAYFTEQ